MAHSPQCPSVRRLISLLHATRGRPQQALIVRAQWLGTADHPEQIEHIFAVDGDDAETLEATADLRRVVVRKPKGCFRAYNLAAKKATGDILFPIEDDLMAPAHWDTLTLEAFAGHSEPAAMLVDDSLGNTAIEWVFNRAFVEARGLYSDDYWGLFGDTELRERLRKDGVTRLPSRLLLDHRHHSRGLAQFDETYHRKGLRYGEEMAVYERRKASW